MPRASRASTSSSDGSSSRRLGRQPWHTAVSNAMHACRTPVDGWLCASGTRQRRHSASICGPSSCWQPPLERTSVVSSRSSPTVTRSLAPLAGRRKDPPPPPAAAAALALGGACSPSTRTSSAPHSSRRGASKSSPSAAASSAAAATAAAADDDGTDGTAIKGVPSGASASTSESATSVASLDPSPAAKSRLVKSSQ